MDKGLLLVVFLYLLSLLRVKAHLHVCVHLRFLFLGDTGLECQADHLCSGG